MFIEDFVEHWEFADERARLGKMFVHKRMCAEPTPKDKKNLSLAEKALKDIITAFTQLQEDRERADYDSGWKLVETDVRNAIRLAEDVFTKWREIKDQDLARHHLLLMFGARSN